MAKTAHIQSLQQDVLRYIPVKLIPAAVGLATIIILTRALSPDQYGIYSVVLTTVLLLVQLGGSWLYTAVLFVYPDYYPDRSAEFERETAVIQGITAIPVAVFGYLSIFLMTHRHVLAILGTVVLSVQMFQSLLLGFCQSTRRVITQIRAVAFQSLFQFAFLCGVIYLANGKEAAVLLSISAGYAAGIISLLRQKGRVERGALRFAFPDGELLRRLFGYGMPMCIWFFATQFYTIGDRLLLKYFKAAAEVGQYASFKDLCIGCAGFLTMPLLLASHPIIMMMWKKACPRRDIEELIARNVALLSLFFAPMLMLVHLCGTELLALALGPRYVLGKGVMVFIVLSVYIASLSVYVQKGMEVTGKTTVMAKVAAAVAAFSLITNMFVIPAYGVFGASLVVIVSQVLYIVTLWVLTSDILRVQVSVSFVGKLFVWGAAVEFLCRLSSHPSISSGTGLSPLYYRLTVLGFSTIVLFLTAEEIRSMLGAFHTGTRHN